MAPKQTSLAAQIAKARAEERAKEERDDAVASTKVLPQGKVLVRLVRACYDRRGVYLAPGIVEMDVSEVPSTAKVLTRVVEAPAETPDDSDDE